MSFKSFSTGQAKAEKGKADADSAPASVPNKLTKSAAAPPAKPDSAT